MDNKIIKLEVGHLPTNCYIVIDVKKRAVIVDPGDDPDKIKKTLKSENAQLAFILLTHAHFDHIGALGEFKDDLVYVGEDDFDMVTDDSKNFSARFLNGGFNLRLKHLKKVKDGDSISFFGQCFEVISTPGHTEGSCIYKFNDCLFTGDTLMAGDIGRCDLEGGDINKMRDSTRKIAEMDGDYVIYPGHGNSSRLSVEKLSNPYLKEW